MKADTIKRETVGQGFEYYALMRMSQTTSNFKMILVAPSIPLFRRLPLEEFGIRCVEIQYPPSTGDGVFDLRQQAYESEAQKQTIPTNPESLVAPARISFEDLAPPTTAASLKIAQILLRDGLLNVERSYPEYEVLPIKMRSPHSHDVMCFPDVSQSNGRFVRGGAWWAYAFGHVEEMAKNDVPNISMSAQPWGLDFAVNAELQTSQKVMLRNISRSPAIFDKLLESHGGLQLQTWLKIEHQPRFYHWVLLEKLPYGSWNGRKVLSLSESAQAGYVSLRDGWIRWIEENQGELSPGQSRHMNRTNRSLNLAIRLVRPYEKGDDIWSRTYAEQREHFGFEYARLKPLIDFFQS